MLVYRITTARGKGMYRHCKSIPLDCDGWSESLWTKVHGSCEGSPERPLPCEDGIDFDSSRHIFGFATHTQLLKWVGGENALKKMGKLGGQIKVYRVPDKHVLKGSKQVAFDRKAARRVVCAPADQLKVIKKELTQRKKAV